jgi:RHS repeat-associated protein
MDDGDNQKEITGEDPDDILMAEYRYDALHRRIAKLVPNGENWDRTDYYYTPAGQVAEERFEDAQANKETPAVPRKYQYVWDIRYIHAAVLRDADTDSDGDVLDAGGSERLYYTQDANFNVTALVETDGDIAERYVYDPYGKRTIYDDDWSDEISWANSKQNEILFTGHRLNPESGLYYAGVRYYDPALGRWISWDPVEDTLNLLEYAASEPMGLVDPDGERTVSIKDLETGKTYTAEAPEYADPIPRSEKKTRRVQEGNVGYTVGENHFKAGNCFGIYLTFQAKPSGTSGKEVGWQLTFQTSPGYDCTKCYCCDDGTPAEINFKKWTVRLDAYEVPGRKDIIKPRQGWDHVPGQLAGEGNQPPWCPIEQGPPAGTDLCSHHEFVLTDHPTLNTEWTEKGEKFSAARAGSRLRFEVTAWKVCKTGQTELDKVDFGFVLTYEESKAPRSWDLRVGSQHTDWEPGTIE